MMKKLEIWADERYPDYGVSELRPGAVRFVEMTDSDYEDYCRTSAEYEAWQARLAKWHVLKT